MRQPYRRRPARRPLVARPGGWRLLLRLLSAAVIVGIVGMHGFTGPAMAQPSVPAPQHHAPQHHVPQHHAADHRGADRPAADHSAGGRHDAGASPCDCSPDQHLHPGGMCEGTPAAGGPTIPAPSLVALVDGSAMVAPAVVPAYVDDEPSRFRRPSLVALQICRT